MIWKLPHPIRGVVAGVLTFGVLGALMGFGVGFGVGLPELVVLAVVSVAAFWLVATRSRVGSRPS